MATTKTKPADSAGEAPVGSATPPEPAKESKAKASPPPPPPKNIWEATLKVMEKIGYVKKLNPSQEKVRKSKMGIDSGKGLPYTYLNIDDLISEVRPVMVKFGIVVKPHKIEVQTHEDTTTKDGSKIRRVIVKTIYRFIHAPSGTFEECEVIGEGMDNFDKASNKSMTVGLKYALRQYFLLETGDDDPDSDPRNSEQPKMTEGVTQTFGDWCRVVETAATMEVLDAHKRTFTDLQSKTGVFTAEQIKGIQDRYKASKKRIAEAAANPGGNPPPDDEPPPE